MMNILSTTVKRVTSTSIVRKITYTRMSDEIRCAKSAFAVCQFTEAMNKPLGFRIFINDPVTVNMFPDYFKLGKAEYGYNLDAFIDLITDTTNNSETTVASRDSLFLSVVKCILPHCVVHQNQSIPSSENNFAVSIAGALGLLGEQKVLDQILAIEQLKKTIYVPEFENVMPVGKTAVPAIASTGDSLAIYSVSVDSGSKQLMCTQVKSYNINSQAL